MLGLKMMGCQPVGVESAEAAIKALEDKSADLLLTDMRMEGMSGVDLVRDAHARWPEMICVVMTAFASYENAVSAIKAGAYDYLPKPFTTEQLEHLIRKVEMLVDLQRENSRLRAGSGDWFDGLTSPKCQALQSVVERIAPSDATVLLSGETGSGKTELARSIHRRSARADKPFVEVTCTAIAENLFESEVFGHVRGAFTGAVRDKAGKFELADGGTLFLDELNSMRLGMQAKLLRALQERLIQRIGGTGYIPIDVRVIASCNEDAYALSETGKLRKDLFYRLASVVIDIPPLRERLSDLKELVWHYVREHRDMAAQPVDEIRPAFWERLEKHSWPGNVRELFHIMDYALSVSEGGVLTGTEFPGYFLRLQQSRPELPPAAEREEIAPASSHSFNQLVQNYQRRLILQAYQASGENVTRAARQLGLSRQNVQYYLKKFGLNQED